MIFDGDRDYVSDYLRYLANQVGLRDWFLYHSHGTPQDEGLTKLAKASCTTEYGQKVASIAFRGDWMEESEDDFRWTCVHELLHCHFRAIEQPLVDISDALGELAYTPVYSAFKVAQEHCIDAIAYEWSRHLPLPGEWLEMATEPEGVY